MDNILYTNTINHYLFQELEVETRQNLIKDIEYLYQTYITNNNKIWASMEYLNSIIFNTLICKDKVDNIEAIFLAVIFKHIRFDDFISDLEGNFLNTINFEEAKEFILARPYLLVYYVKVKFLLTEPVYSFNDIGVTGSDFTYFQDILSYNSPIIYLDNRYTVYYDDELLNIKTCYKGDLPKYNYTKKDIYNIIEKIGLKSSKFNTQFFQQLNEIKFKKFINLYKKGF